MTRAGDDSMRNAPVIYIVVPCYNEEEVLPLTAEFLGKKLDDLTRSRRIHPGSRRGACGRRF